MHDCVDNNLEMTSIEENSEDTDMARNLQGFKESKSALGGDASCDCRRLGRISLRLETVDYYSLPATS